MAIDTVVLLDPAAGPLITDVCSAARDCHDDAIADAIAELFESLAGQLFETVPGAAPVTLRLTPLAASRLRRAHYALNRYPDIGRSTVLLLLRLLIRDGGERLAA